MLAPRLLRSPSDGRHLPVLEGVRGLAVGIVLVSHMSTAGVLLYPGLNFKGRGAWGIYLFFVLSAFLLTWHYLETPERIANSLRYWRGYAGRRIARIYPLYTLALLLTAVSPLVSFALAGKEEPSVWRHLLLLDGYKIFWTIPVEMKMYALLPFLLTAVYGVARGRTGRSLATLLAFLLATAWLWPPDVVTYRSVDLHDFLAPFVVGFMAAFAWRDLSRRELSVSVRRCCDLAGLLALVAILAPWLLGDPFGPSHRLARTVLGNDAAWYGAAWGIVLLCTLAGRGLLQRLFEFRPLRVLGVVSFSAYIWHMPILEGLRRTSFANRGEPMSFPIIFAAVVLISIVSFLVVEQPAMQAFARWSRRGRT
ncbi:MAG: acyltransferase family protein [Candidatus Binatia bacterium]